MIDYAYYFFKHIKYDKDRFSGFRNDVIAAGELIFRGSYAFIYCNPTPHELEFIELIDGNGFHIEKDHDRYTIIIIYD